MEETQVCRCGSSRWSLDRGAFPADLSTVQRWCQSLREKGKSCYALTTRGSQRREVKNPEHVEDARCHPAQSLQQPRIAQSRVPASAPRAQRWRSRTPQGRERGVGSCCEALVSAAELDSGHGSARVQAETDQVMRRGAGPAQIAHLRRAVEVIRKLLGRVALVDEPDLGAGAFRAAA